jgi:hypothetical protein
MAGIFICLKSRQASLLAGAGLPSPAEQIVLEPQGLTAGKKFLLLQWLAFTEHDLLPSRAGQC